MEMRKGDWIQTFSGNKIYPLDPRPEEIWIVDIAHALSNICRFTGHSRHFYSVAEHSTLGAEIILSHGRDQWMIDLAKAFLLHDAAEAYIGDMSRPMKRSIEGWHSIERNLQIMIFRKFGVDPVTGFSKDIHDLDNSLLYTEGEQLMGGTEDWHDAVNVPKFGIKIPHMWPHEAEKYFLDMYSNLFGQP